MGGEIPREFSFTELPVDLEHIEPQLNLAFRRVPALNDVGIKLFFCGPESFTSDSRALMGPTAEVRGLYVAAGFNSYGILSSGGAGKVMAAWLTEGIPPLAMTAMHAQRVMAFQANSRYMQDRVVEALGFNMSLHWPGHQLRTARGHPANSPVHDWLIYGGRHHGRAGRMGDSKRFTSVTLVARTRGRRVSHTKPGSRCFQPNAQLPGIGRPSSTSRATASFS